MIIVTGATGVLNGATVEQLLQRVSPSDIGVSVRDPRRAQHLADRGVRVRQGSYDDPDALRDSFADAEQVLLVSSSDLSADVVAQHRAAIDAGIDVGTKRILYTSSHGAGVDTPYPPLAIHAATEQHLAASGAAWTALRNGFYGDLDQLLGPWRETGVIAKPADGPFSWVDRRDAAEAAAAILTSDAQPDGPVDLTLTTPITLADFAAAASDLSGRPVERVAVDDNGWIAGEIANGVPEQVARFTLSMFQATRSGHFSHPDPSLSRLLGREPRSIAEQLADQSAQRG
ncbi:NAD(P)H-binding protein [Brachybacterium saurashtrense]|uniref:SDR family NAD(P)-dependent oxidoreductase n=1 Tax=Brachybacterium saurashtrense TaxID=556288 RepID=A0A345YRK0_9MICO|nr:NAD(P)H-binding protein [Brachybacterium saurashtrense]AXK46552.1 SDR family NAD(P)-dependent oxidoreductase [Brachybacterium saurashtrense]RRR24293.1 SDR family NAD(P)-dependent oxidoreductase [Brachybacterium saurashtrense]